MAKNSFLNPGLLVIGGSAGSLEVIMELLPVLSASIRFAVVIVIHRRNSDSVLTELLGEKTVLPVKEVEEKEAITPATVYIAPADYHLLVEEDQSFSLDFSEKLHYSRPGIDATFETAADAYGPSLCCILLSGANADGAEGLRYVKEKGGRTIVQNPDNATVAYMPQQAIAHSLIDRILTTEEMVELIAEMR